MNLNQGTPAAPGLYNVNGSAHGLQRQWHPASGWSAPAYRDDPDDIRQRAWSTPADRELAGRIMWAAISAQ